jgi:hypothetical protein
MPATSSSWRDLGAILTPPREKAVVLEADASPDRVRFTTRDVILKIEVGSAPALPLLPAISRRTWAISGGDIIQ